MSTGLEHDAPSSVSPIRRFLLLPPVRLLIAVFLIGAINKALSFLIDLILPPTRAAWLFFGNSESGRGGLLSGELSLTLSTVLVMIFLGRVIERRHNLNEFASRSRDALRDIWLGFGGGGILMSLIILLLVVPGWYYLSPGTSSPHALFGIAVNFLLVAVFEECLFRGILFRIIDGGMGPWGAILISSLLFGGAHLLNPHATAIAAIGIAVEAGVLLGAAYLWKRNIWLPIGIHWAWNLFEGSVYGAPVSGNNDLPTLLHCTSTGPALWTGGAFGPEAGLSAILLASIAGTLLLYFAWRRSKLEKKAPILGTHACLIPGPSPLQGEGSLDTGSATVNP